MPAPAGGDPASPLAGRWTVPTRSATNVGILILPPPGYAHSSSFHAWTLLAERLAGRGLPVLRLDLYGTGDSAGMSGDVRSLAQWDESLRLGLDQLEAAGVDRVALVGCDLSGSIVLETSDDRVVAKVVVSPAASGRRRVRELRMMGQSFPDGSGDVSVAGTTFRAELINSIAATDGASCPVQSVATLLVDSHPGPFELTTNEWAAADDRPHDYLVAEEILEFLERPAEEATVGTSAVDAIVSWLLATITAILGKLHGGTIDLPAGVGRAQPLAWSDRTVTEEFVTVGSRQLAGVLTRLSDSSPTEIVVFLNSGSDPHTGPGRAWVEFARDVVTSERAALRLDFRGWGDSPRGPAGPGRPYDAHAADDLADAIATLRAAGWSRIGLVGLCAGAWRALKAACTDPVDVVVAINPQMYWQPGDPVEALMSTTRARRLPEIKEIARLAASGVWDAEDARGDRPPAGEWLDALASRRIPIAMVFAENDDGLEYLRDRLGRRLREVLAGNDIQVVEVPDIDHGMQRVWLRPSMLHVIDGTLGRHRLSGQSAPRPETSCS